MSSVALHAIALVFWIGALFFAGCYMASLIDPDPETDDYVSSLFFIFTVILSVFAFVLQVAA